MFVLPHELMVLLMHKLTNKLDLISIACKLFASNSGKKVTESLAHFNEQ